MGGYKREYIGGDKKVRIQIKFLYIQTGICKYKDEYKYF